MFGARSFGRLKKKRTLHIKGVQIFSPTFVRRNIFGTFEYSEKIYSCASSSATHEIHSPYSMSVIGLQQTILEMEPAEVTMRRWTRMQQSTKDKLHRIFMPNMEMEVILILQSESPSSQWLMARRCLPSKRKWSAHLVAYNAIARRARTFFSYSSTRSAG